MKIKPERWLSDLFPGRQKLLSEYHNLPPRELALVACAILDAALVELITRRFPQRETKETATFLGIEGDSRAPCGTFGARIQLAYLLGILTESDKQILRSIKNIRNCFAHSVKKHYASKEIVTQLNLMLEHFDIRYNEMVKAGFIVQSMKDKQGNLVQGKPFPLWRDVFPESKLHTDPVCGQYLLFVVFFNYHSYFHEVLEQIPPLGPLCFSHNAKQKITA